MVFNANCTKYKTIELLPNSLFHARTVLVQPKRACVSSRHIIYPGPPRGAQGVQGQRGKMHRGPGPYRGPTRLEIGWVKSLLTANLLLFAIVGK